MHDDSEYFDTPELPLGVRLVLSVIEGVGDALMAVFRALPVGEPSDE
jgi:hypothetical protein